jgi:hypothetical protein
MSFTQNLNLYPHCEEELVVPQFRQIIGIYCESPREHTRTP